MRAGTPICLGRMVSPIGELLLGAVGERLCLVDFAHRRGRFRPLERLRRHYCAEVREADAKCKVLEAARRQLMEYFAGRRKGFDLPLLSPGSPFQERVWAGLQDIPHGRTLSYGELAARIGHPRAARAVAAANAANALSIIIPCHRVTAGDGGLGGYAGGVEAKRFLLELEGVSSIG